MPAFRSKLECVADQVQNHAVHAVPVAEHHRVPEAVVFHGKGDVLAHHLRLEHVADFVHHFPQVGGPLFQFHLPDFDAAHFEHVVDEGHQVHVRGVNLGQVFLDLLGGRLRFARQVGVADNGIHGRAQVVTHVRKEYGLCLVGFLGNMLFVVQFLFTLLLRAVDVHHDENAQDDEESFYQVVLQLGITDKVHLLFHEVLFLYHLGFGHGNMHLFMQIRMELADMHNDFLGLVVGDLAFPHHRREQQYEQHGHPHDGRLAETVLLVAHEHGPVNDEPHNAPRHQNHEGFRGNCVHVPKRRRKREEKEEGGYYDTQDSGKVQHRLSPAGFTAGNFHYPRRNIQINDRCTDGGDVHNPADGRSPEERNNAGKEHHVDNAVVGGAVTVDMPEPGRHHGIFGEAQEHAPDCSVKPKKARGNGRRDGYGEHNKAAVAEGPENGVEYRDGIDSLEVLQVGKIGFPIAGSCRVCRNRKKSYEGVDNRSGCKSRHHDGETVFRLEVIGGRGKAHHAKAYKCPGGKHQHVHDLHQGGMVLRDSRRRKGRAHIREINPALAGNNCKQADHTAKEYEGKHRIHQAQHVGVPATDEPEQKYNCKRGKQLACPDLVAHDGITEAPLQYGSEQETDKQHKGRHIGPQYRQVRKGRGPGAKEGMVVAEKLLGKGEYAPRAGNAVHHDVEIVGDNTHQHGAKHKGDNCSQGARNRQERCRGHHECTPAYGTTEGERPRTQNGQFFVFFRQHNATPLSTSAKFSQVP